MVSALAPVTAPPIGAALLLARAWRPAPPGPPLPIRILSLLLLLPLPMLMLPRPSHPAPMGVLPQWPAPMVLLLPMGLPPPV